MRGLSDDDDDAKTVRGIERAGSGASTRSVSPGVSTGQYDCYIGKTDMSIAHIGCGRQHHDRREEGVKLRSRDSLTRAIDLKYAREDEVL